MTVELTSRQQERQTRANHTKPSARKSHAAGTGFKDEERYRQILASMDQAYFETDLDTTLTYFTDAFCQLFECRHAESVHIRLADLIAPEEIQKLSNALDTVHKIKAPAPKFSCAIHRKDGSPSVVEITLGFLRNHGNDDPAGFYGLARDVTDTVALKTSLKEAEDNYQQLLDAAPYSISIFKASDGRYVQVSKSFCQHMGYSVAQAIGRTASELSLHLNKEDEHLVIKSLQRDKQMDRMEMCFKARDGRVFDTLLSARPIKFKGEECYLSIATDITPIKEAQRALLEKEESQRAILETAPYSITILKLADMRYVQANNSFCQRIGLSREEIIGRTTLELDLYADLTDRERFLKTYRDNGFVDGMQIRFRIKDGSAAESLISARPIRFQGQECVLVISADVTALKEAQRALAEREQKYRNILLNMKEGYWEVDLRGNFTFMNEAEAQLHRSSVQELLGHNNRTFSKPKTSKKIFKLFNDVYKTGTPARVFDYELTREDGSEAVIELSASLLKDSTGKPIGFFGVSRDMTEKRNADKELEKYRRHLEELVTERTKELEAAQSELVKREKLSVLGQLTATVSHELRNPLGVIRSSNFYLQKRVKERDEKIDKHFKRIEEQVGLCDTIVADLLEYTRGRNASMVVAHIQPWMNELMDQQQEAKAIRIDRQIADGLPPIAHDQEKIRRALLNLLDNALQAVRQKQETLKDSTAYHPVIQVSAQRDNDHIVLTVRDNGVGMDADTRRQAFEPLFTTRARGTGIGLAIVKKIVAEHSGAIELDSVPGQGTTATITLPCVNNR